MRNDDKSFGECTDRAPPIRFGRFLMRSLDISHPSAANPEGPPVKVERFVFDRGDSVAILLLDVATREVILVRQFRPGPAARNVPAGTLRADDGADDPRIIETVAGTMDVRGEDPIDVAKREVAEEAPGCEIIDVVPIASYYPSPGGSTEKIHLLIARVDSSAAAERGGLAEHGEDIVVERIPVERAFAEVDAGRITSSTALIALLFLRTRINEFLS
jgi:ADP-ribose pyrophosphatase